MQVTVYHDFKISLQSHFGVKMLCVYHHVRSNADAKSCDRLFVLSYLSPVLYQMARRVLVIACDFQQCGILSCVDSNEHVQPHFKLRNSKLIQSVA